MADDLQHGKVPVLECVREAYRFFQANWVKLAPVCALVGAGAGLSLLLPATPDGAALSYVVSVLTGVILAGATLRLAVRGEMVGPGGVGFGADELRLLGVTASLGLMFMPFILLIGGVLSAVLVGKLGMTVEQAAALIRKPEDLANALAMLEPNAPMEFSAFLLVCTGLIVFLVIRLALVNAATIGERKILVFQTWAWTKGNFWRVLGAVVLTILPGFLITGIFAEALNGMLLRSGGGAAVVLVVGAVDGFIGALANIPALALAAHLYKGLRPPEFVAK